MAGELIGGQNVGDTSGRPGDIDGSTGLQTGRVPGVVFLRGGYCALDLHLAPLLGLDLETFRRIAQERADRFTPEERFRLFSREWDAQQWRPDWTPDPPWAYSPAGVYRMTLYVTTQEALELREYIARGGAASPAQ